MPITPSLFPELILRIELTIAAHADEVTELDQAIGDGDHVFNLQHGLQALAAEAPAIAAQPWPDAWRKIGMLLMSKVGGASGALYATLFIALAKSAPAEPAVSDFAAAFGLAVEAVKQRGKAEAGEKTLLDVLIPVAAALKLHADAAAPLPELLAQIPPLAEASAEATRDMLATKGRASFLGERSRGHIDAGAKTAALMIAAVCQTLSQNLGAQP